MEKRLTVLLAMLAVLVAAPVHAEDTKQDMIHRVENGIFHRIQVGSQSPMNLEERIQSLHIPGLGLAVVQDFQVQWAKTYGVRDSRTGAPVTEETLFQAASITKSITAVIALRLVQDGILNLDTDVNGYLERWKVPENEFTRVEKVTLRRLLSHTAGLTVRGMSSYAEGKAVPTILQVLDGLPPASNAPVRVDRVPGSEIVYSGGGYVVLQLLLEDVTGRSLPELANEYVFEPAGMTYSTFCPARSDAPAGDVSIGHSADSDGNLTTFKGHAFLQEGSGCCELWTTASDLARFIVALQRALRGDPGSILSLEVARAMITPQENVSKGPGVFDKGLGLDLPRFGDVVYFNHDGGNVGFAARFIAHPERGCGFAVMINTDHAFSILEELTRAVAGAYEWEGFKKPAFYRDAASLIDEIRQELRDAPDDPANSEGSLNEKGYSLLSCGYLDAAIGVFMLNLEVHPRSANCSDSIAEAYERNGDPANALKYYRRAVDLMNRFPEENKGYEPFRATAAEKIRNLEAEGER